MNIKPIKIQVRFSDVDMMGHVNNAIYLNYFELARMLYFEQLLGESWDWMGKGIILKKNEIEYIKPLRLEDDPEIKILVEHIGNKSFSLSYDLRVNQESYTKGVSVLVAFDYINKETVPIHEEMKNILLKVKSEQ